MPDKAGIPETRGRPEIRPRSITKNAVFLAFASSTNILFQLAWVALVSRGLGEAGLGVYSFGLAVTQTLGILADFGLNLFLTREVAGNKGRASVLLGSSIYAKTAASGLIWLLLLLFINHPQIAGYRNGILWMAAANYLQAISLSFSSVMRAFERMEYEAGSSLLFNVLNLSLCFLVLRQGGKAESLAMVYALTAVVQLVFLALIYRRKFGSVIWRPEPGFVKLWLNSVIWLGLGGAFFFIYDRGPQILLGMMRGEQELGSYAAAYRMVLALGLMPTLLGSAMLPRLSNHFASGGREELKRMLDKSLKLLLLAGLALSLSVYFMAPWIVKTALGGKMSAAVPVLQILVWALVLNFPGSVLGNLLVASNDGRRYALFSFLEMAIGIGACVALIPVFGGRGAALAAVAASSLVNLAIWIYTKKRHGWLWN